MIKVSIIQWFKYPKCVCPAHIASKYEEKFIGLIADLEKSTVTVENFSIVLSITDRIPLPNQSLRIQKT